MRAKLTNTESRVQFPIGLCACGTTTRHRRKNGDPWCVPCQVRATRAAEEAKGIPFEPFPLMPAMQGRHENFRF